ncbi:MAG: 1,4-alpha-glucan branching protein GlgB [Vulcanimicrobiaceae bacterium]
MIAERRRIEALAHGTEEDPFGFLGMRRENDALVVRAFRPRASGLELVDLRDGSTVGAFERLHPDGFFRLALPAREPFPYRLRERRGAAAFEFDDPYRFGPLLGELDAWLIAEGNHLRLYEALGAHSRICEGVAGTSFALWAPNARRASVVGDFNDWDGRVHAMRCRSECGVWEIFIPGDLEGAQYKYELTGPDGALLPLRADPFAFSSELRPRTASIVVAPSAFAWSDDAWLAGRGRRIGTTEPISIYEVHLGSWKRAGERGERMLGYRELAADLLPYVAELGFTHLELLPVGEHPFDGSWGYQSMGLFAPTSRHGSPDDFRAFVDRAHALGLGVLLDWVPAHFPADAHGLANFDGTHLYEHADPRKGFHHRWGTYAYNLGRREVANVLIASALYWLREFHVDGLRVDAVSSMIYLDYDRPTGTWIPNAFGGNEHLEATAFLRRFNETVYREIEGIVTVAEESTAWPKVSWPTSLGGLGFGYKWNMGWMHDVLRLFARDPLYRGHHLEELTFGLLYAFSENFILPFSHDEVVHLKRSLLGKMPGDDAVRFASLRALYGLLYTHPGKKLLFMGGEFAQENEWTEAHSLDWHLLDDPRRRGVQRLVRDLNALYRETAALHRGDASSEGFRWIDCSDRGNVVVSFIRRDPAGDGELIVVLNLSGLTHEGYRIGVPRAGHYRERLTTDAARYGGGDRTNGAVEASAPGAHGLPAALSLVLPAQTLLVFEPA